MAKCKKVKFGTEQQAEEYLAKLRKTSNRRVIPERVYLCPECLVWHLTSANNGNEKKLQEKLDKRTKEIVNLQKAVNRYKDKIRELEYGEVSNLDMYRRCLDALHIKYHDVTEDGHTYISKIGPHDRKNRLWVDGKMVKIKSGNQLSNFCEFDENGNLVSW